MLSTTNNIDLRRELISHDDTSAWNSRSVTRLRFFLASSSVLRLLFSLVQALLVGLVVAALVRVPVFRNSGTVRLITDAEPDAVQADFEGATPPPLAFQWESLTRFARQTTA